FLTVGDVDGDGHKEIVAAANKKGLWLLRPYRNGPWDKELIDAGSSGFEHAAILLDLDGDKRDELYVASDNQKEVRRYDWTSKGWRHEVLLKYEDKLNRLTWNIMAVPTALLPASGMAITDSAAGAIFTKLAPPKPKESPPAAVARKPEEPEKPSEPRGLRLNSNEAEPGYVLYAPLLTDTTYLIDDKG